MEILILELIFTILCLPGLTSAGCYYNSYYYNYYCYYYYYYYYYSDNYDDSSVGTYVGAFVGGIVFLIVVAVVVLCICAAKNSQRNRIVTMHGGGATVTNVNCVNTIQHPPPPAGYGYGAPPPPGYGPGYGPGYAQPSQSMFGGGDPVYPPNQYPPPKY
ncbi:protein shisa-4-like [Crassostrea angulata]|uniref:protein shisa-4-like n=1 Tax=Magallana angulata TaxID=2784310 RepID=UPI0022B1FC3A|nr:protein shisa-4-like [Crassostrea angulata]